VKVDEELIQIGEVAERVRLSLRTVRYYEEMGLLVPQTRTQGGFRMYSEDQVARLELIKRMKPLGFSVQEMRELLEARDLLRDPATPHERRAPAHTTLKRFAGAAAERVEELRRQVDDAEAFADQVRRESRRSRRPIVKQT
jgi:DNA-binding transcriptional MerR regulator